MKTIYTVHGNGFEVSDILSERVRFVEHEALEDVKHQLATENDITFISLGGVENDNHEKNAHVAYDLLQAHKEKIPQGSQVLTLGGGSFMEECLEVVKYVQSTYKNEKVRIVTGVEDSPFRPFRLKLAYKIAFVLTPAVNFAQKHPTAYRIFAPILSFGAIFMPFITGELVVGYYDYPFLKKGGRMKELASLFKMFFNPLKTELEQKQPEEGVKKSSVDQEESKEVSKEEVQASKKEEAVRTSNNQVAQAV